MIRIITPRSPAVLLGYGATAATERWFENEFNLISWNQTFERIMCIRHSNATNEEGWKIRWTQPVLVSFFFGFTKPTTTVNIDVDLFESFERHITIVIYLCSNAWPPMILCEGLWYVRWGVCRRWQWNESIRMFSWKVKTITYRCICIICIISPFSPRSWWAP